MKKQLLLNILLSFFIIIFDQLTKIFAGNYLTNNAINIISNVFSLSYVENKGVAFGLFSGRNVGIIIVTLLISILVIKLFLNALKLKEYKLCALFSMIFAGFLGNFIDRIRLGYVVDFISLDIINFPVFNIADIFITVPSLIIMIFVFKLSETEFSAIFSLKGGKNEKK